MNNTFCDSPSFEYLGASDVWPFMHVIHPLFICFLLELPIITLVFMYVSETIENLLASAFVDGYFIFLGETKGDLEPCSDSLQGDIYCGLLGIILFIQLYRLCGMCLLRYGYTTKTFCGVTVPSNFVLIRALVVYIPFLLGSLFFNYSRNGYPVGVIVFVIIFTFSMFLYCKLFDSRWKGRTWCKKSLPGPITHHTEETQSKNNLYCDVDKCPPRNDKIHIKTQISNKKTVFCVYVYLNCLLFLLCAIYPYYPSYKVATAAFMFCFIFNMTILFFRDRC